jgi:hypothetical protein
MGEHFTGNAANCKRLQFKVRLLESCAGKNVEHRDFPVFYRHFALAGLQCKRLQKPFDAAA